MAAYTEAGAGGAPEKRRVSVEVCEKDCLRDFDYSDGEYTVSTGA